MLPVPDSFTFDYRGSRVVYGRGCIRRLGTYLSDRNLRRALIVCGSNTGANEALLHPIERSLGNKLVGVFDETTSDKLAKTAYDGHEVMQEEGVNVLIGIGGGSSIDTARLMSTLADDGLSFDNLQSEIESEGEVEQMRGGDSITPLITIPTTFAGADISSGCSLEVSGPDDPPLGEVIRVTVSDPRTLPVAMFYDPDLFGTTPPSVLAGSAINGFDKGIETIYSRHATPVSDGMSIHGLRLLKAGLPKLLAGDREAVERSVVGIILVQLERWTAIVHAFGHGYSRRYPVQQGHVHAIVVPHVLRYVFDRADARRAVLADGLEIDADSLTHDELGEAIVDEVVSIRDSLRLPTRLRDLDAVDRADFPDVAEFIRDDFPMRRNPDGVDPTREEIEAILETAW